MKNEKNTQLANTDLDQLCVNAIRFLSIDAVQKANSGHPGLPMDAAPMAYVLWSRIMNYDPKKPLWFNRDRFVLSAGHGSMLLYSMLHLTGYDLSLDQIKNFRQWGSITPGHPERGLTPGVEVTTGPLGQGFANGVGLAMAEAHLAARFNRPDMPIIDHFTYGIVSDGDLMEGVASEAASLAGHLGLGKLIYLYDSNHITLAGSTSLTFTEDCAQRFQSYGWHTVSVKDGNNLEEIEKAIREAQSVTDKPSLIIVRTYIGYGSPNKQDSFEAHGSPLGPDEVKLTKENLNWPVEPDFYLPEEVLKHFHEAINKGKEVEEEWTKKLKEYEKAFPDLFADFKAVMGTELPKGWDREVKPFPADPKGMATRVASGKVLNQMAVYLPELMGGSADLNPSTYTALKDKGDFQNPSFEAQDKQGEVGGAWGYAGRNIAFGVREHAMGSICNGMAAHGGIIPYCSTFLTFSDYMRPSIRLAALMELRVLFIFTHDSIGLGEDGPTHQSIEQTASLRLIPHLIVLRPGDANETAEALRVAIETDNRPTALILSRQNLPTFDRSKVASADGVRKGAYILSEAANGKPDVILMATGSEVHLILEVQKKLQEKNIQARVVSVPSFELFNDQSAEYQASVLPPSIKKRLAVEAGVTLIWWRYVGDEGDVLGVNRFGASAPGPEVMEKYGFSVPHICERVESLLKGIKLELPKPDYTKASE